MVFKGTKTRSAERIAEEVDSIGGHMDAFTAKEYASFHLKVLDEHLPLAVDILGDIVVNPLFDPAEMAREKQVIFEEINMVEDTPDDLVMELFADAFWPEHPLGRLDPRDQALGRPRSRREDLARFFARVYQPGNVVIAAAGHLDHEAVSALVGRQFAIPRARRSPANGRAPRVDTRVVTRSKRALEQVHICLGARGYPQTHPDRYGCYILNTVLGRVDVVAALPERPREARPRLLDLVGGHRLHGLRPVQHLRRHQPRVGPRGDPADARGDPPRCGGSRWARRSCAGRRTT